MDMSWAIRSGLAMLSLIAGTIAGAQELIPWTTSLEQAQRAATEQRKLLLVHFYNDNCAPCERLEKNVFSQSKVAESIGRNYIPVKIHAGQQPRVAEHYRVERWPVDLVCTPEGLEIYRTVSPQSPDQYILLCDNVALQAGVGAGRQWATTMQVAGQQALDQTTAQAAAGAQHVGQQLAGVQDAAILAAANGTNQATVAGNGYLGQANAAVQGYAQQADQQVTNATQQVNQAAQTATQTAQQAQAKAQDWTRRIGDSTGQLSAAGQQFGQTAQTTARDLRAAWDPAALRGQLPYGAAPPASPTAAAIGAATGSIYGPGPTATAPVHPEPALPTNNPWIGQQQGPNVAAAPQPTVAAPTNTVAPPPEIAAAIATLRGNPPAGSIAPTAASNPPSNPAPAANTAAQLATGAVAERPMVQASQAPPTAMEGYCPVTLLDARKWHKANPQFGAIHRGRTYLFRSATEQTKFLADPDRYSPVLSGFDPVVFATRGEQIEGKRSYGLTYNRQIYLFADEQTLRAFEQSPQAYATAAHTAMMRAESSPQYR
jgi:YHS domain-containing protein